MERTYLDICFQEIREKLDWTDIDQWTDNQFDELREKVLNASGISISTKTLKRITGKIKLSYQNAENYNPQLATKNALAIYLGYRSWKEFIDAHNKEKRKISWWPIIVLIGILLSYYLYRAYKGSHSSIDELAKNTHFQCINPKGFAPHNAIISYELKNVKTDSVLIDYNDRYMIDPGHYDIESVKKNKGHVSYSYLMPDVYFPVLKINGKPIKKSMVVVKSKGWLGNLCYWDDKNNLYRYRLIDSSLQSTKDISILDSKNEKLYFSIDKLKKLFSDIIQKDNYFLEYRNINDFGFSADDIIIEISFKNSYQEGGSRCQDFIFIGKCQYGIIKAKFLKSGCTQWAEFVAGDKRKVGNEKDMRHFGLINNQAHQMKYRIKNQHATLYFDQNKVDEFENIAKLGDFYGVILIFKGVGSVYDISVKNNNGELLFKDSFSE